MGLLLAAGRYEEWVRDNAPLLAALVCVLLALLVLRLVVRTVTRMLLLAILLMITIFIAAERDEIQKCAQTCECELAGVETSVAFCDPDLGS